MNEKSLVLLLIVVTIITIFIILFNLPSEINAINKANIGRVFIPDSIERDKPHHIHENDHQHPAPPMLPVDVEDNEEKKKKEPESESESDESDNSYRLEKVKQVSFSFFEQ